MQLYLYIMKMEQFFYFTRQLLMFLLVLVSINYSRVQKHTSRKFVKIGFRIQKPINLHFIHTFAACAVLVTDFPVAWSVTLTVA